MAPTGGYSWSDLNTELLVSIATAADNGFSLRDYTCLRGVCTEWRSALPPPYPCLLSLANDRASAHPSPVSSSLHPNTAFSKFDGRRDDPFKHFRDRPCVAGSGNGAAFVVFSLPLRRSFHLGMATPTTMDGRHDDRRCMELPSRARVVGSGNGHASIFSFTLTPAAFWDRDTSSTELQIRTRVVGSGNGRFAVAIDHGKKYYSTEGGISISFWTARILLLYLYPRTGKEVELVPVPRKGCECVHKIVFAPDPDDGTVVAMCDGMKIAYIDTSRGDDMNWTAVDVEHIVDLVFDDEGGKVYCLDSCGGVRVLPIPRGCRNKQDQPAAVADEPSLTLLSVPGSASFAPPYDAVSSLTFTKHLFFCHGSLYQMWQNKSSTVNLSNGFTMSADEIFVLRYDPRRCPCWNAVKDLGGCSVFVGMNSGPTVVRAAGGAFPRVRVRPDCVYWIDWRRVPMVCDVATRTSKPWVDLPYGAITGSTCWYFDDANMTSIDGN